MNENNYLVILAGGAGSRFWPISSEELPKQFLDILGCGRTLIQLTLERFNGLIPKENVWVVTAEKYREIVMEQRLKSLQAIFCANLVAAIQPPVFAMLVGK